MKRSTEDKLKLLCVAHGQLTQTIEAHKDNDGACEILQSTWNKQLIELEKRIISVVSRVFRTLGFK